MGEITTVRSNGYDMLYDDQEVYNSFEKNEYRYLV